MINRRTLLAAIGTLASAVPLGLGLTVVARKPLKAVTIQRNVLELGYLTKHWQIDATGESEDLRKLVLAFVERVDEPHAELQASWYKNFYTCDESLRFFVTDAGLLEFYAAADSVGCVVTEGYPAPVSIVYQYEPKETI